MSAGGGQDLVRRKLRVRGLVQGVFFRAGTRERARDLGVVGWVRNCDDGSVEIEVEGPRGAVDALASWARGGPPGARVDDVEEAELAPLGRETGFHLRR